MSKDGVATGWLSTTSGITAAATLRLTGGAASCRCARNVGLFTRPFVASRTDQVRSTNSSNKPLRLWGIHDRRQ